MQPISNAAQDLEDAMRRLQEVTAMLEASRARTASTQPCSQEEFARRTSLSYENTISFLKDYPEFLTAKNPSGDILLHGIVSGVQIDPKARIYALALCMALLDLGVKDCPNSVGRFAHQLAYESGDLMLIGIFTASTHCKNTLLDLAREHNEHELLDWLTKKVEVEMLSRHPRRDTIEREMLELHNRARVEQARKDEPALHTAIYEFLSGEHTVISDILDFLQLPDALNQTNTSGSNALELAKESAFLTELFSLKSPTKEAAIELACRMDLTVVVEVLLGE